MTTETTKKAADELPQEDFKAFLEQLLTLLPPKYREQVKRYSREIIAGVITVILVIVLASGYSHYREGQEKQAATLLGTSLYEREPSKRLDVLKQVVEQHGGTDAARLATLLMAKAYADTGDQEKALEQFRTAQKKMPRKSVLRQTALLGTGYVLEEKGDLEGALKSFSQAQEVSKALERIALMDKARVAKRAGKVDLALNAFNKIISENPSSQDLDFVRFEILELKSSEKGAKTAK